MKAPFSLLPALPLTVGMIVGIVISIYGYALIAVMLFIIVFGILYYKGKHYISIFFLMGAVGCILAFVNRPSTLPQQWFENAHLWVGKLQRVEETSFGMRCIVKLQQCDSCYAERQRILLRLNSYDNDLEDGCIIEFKSIMHPLNQADGLYYENPLINQLTYQGIVAQTYYYDKSIKIISKPSQVQAMINRWRYCIYNAIVEAPISVDTSAFLLAAFLGDDFYLTEELMTKYRTLGIAHIMAISGLHVGIIASLLSFLLLPIRSLRHGRVLRFIITCSLIWVYAVLVGFQPSVVRAAVMITVFMVSNLLQRGYSPFNSLCLALSIILLFDPFALFTVGLQLSFGAVTSIFLFSRLLPDRLRRRPVLFYLISLIFIPVTAMVGTWMFSAYYFGTFPMMFLLGNLIMGLFFPCILTMGICITMASAVGFKMYILGSILDWIMSAMQGLINMVDYGLGFQLTGLHFTAWAFLPYLAAIAILSTLLFVHLSRSMRTALLYGLGAAIILLVLCFSIHTKPKLPYELYTTRTSPSAIIFRAHNQAYLMPIGMDSLSSDQDLKILNQRYSRFLQYHDCTDGINLMPDTISLGPFLRHGSLFVIDKTLLYVINDDNNYYIPADMHINYGLVGPKFSGSLRAISSSVNVDTFILMPSIPLGRINKFLKESTDSMPVMLASQHPVHITLQ